MENLFDESEQNEMASAVEPEFTDKPSRRLFSRRNIIIAVVVVAVVVVGYFAKGWFVAATVNGRPISRWSVISNLEKASGKDTLDSLITRKLIASELDKQKVVVSDDEVNVQIKKIEDSVASQGGTIEQALAAQGMTKADLTSQILLNLRVEKFFADQVKISDAEVTKYIKDNKLTDSKDQLAQLNDQVRNQLKSDKLNTVVKPWLDTLRAQASIQRWVSY